MRTFKNNESVERGFTLLEALIALSLLSLATLFTVGVVNSRSPQLTVNKIADQLMTDLKQLRLATEIKGLSAATLEGAEDGYAGGDIDRRAPKGVKFEWDGETSASVPLGYGPHQSGSNIRIFLRDAETFVRIAPVTGEISRGL